MRIMLSLCTVLASASLAEAQLGSVTGTVQQTTDLEREELQLDSTSRIGSRLQTGQPTSRLELMRQQQAVRDARRAAVAAREARANEVAAPQATASAVTDTTLQVEDTARAAAQARTDVSANPERVSGTALVDGNAAAGQTVNSAASGQAMAVIEPATSRVLTAAEIAARSTPASVSATLPETPCIAVQTPDAVVVSQGRSRTYSGPVTRSDAVIIRDRHVVEDRATISAQTQAQTQSRSATPPVANRAASRANDTMWISRDSMREHAFPLGCALLLILSLLLALRLFAAPRRRRA